MTTEQLLRNLPAVFAALFVAILFIQSGADKIVDWKGNLEWLTGHFSKTFLARLVPIMLVTITVMEVATGLLAAVGIIYFLVEGSLSLIYFASIVGSASLAALFFGQRVAKDYAGAAVLVPYFILILILMFLTNPYTR
jgi:hypothetical protein